MNPQAMDTLFRPFGAMMATLACAVALAASPVNAQALDKPVSAISEPAASGSSKKAAAKKKAGKKSARPVFVKSSAETTAERTARLKRECKGAVNAGACAGYTR
jgi:predicted exporter